MSFFDRMGDLAKALFTTDLAIKHLQDTVEAQNKQMDALADDVKQVSRELRMMGRAFGAPGSDARRRPRATHGRIAQFKTEVERAQMRFARQLPPCGPSVATRPQTRKIQAMTMTPRPPALNATRAPALRPPAIIGSLIAGACCPC
jgi:hypothetical protein